jgi:hypothetical protein
MERLEQLLLELPHHGIQCFRFKDLVDPLKGDARRRWAILLARDDWKATVECSPDQVQVLRQVLPEQAVETRQSFEHLTRCVAASIERLDADLRTRGYLAALWGFLQLRTGDDTNAAGGCAQLQDEADEGQLSYRQLSQRLQIPRDRLPMLFATLQQLVARCRGRRC